MVGSLWVSCALLLIRKVTSDVRDSVPECEADFAVLWNRLFLFVEIKKILLAVWVKVFRD